MDEPILWWGDDGVFWQCRLPTCMAHIIQYGYARDVYWESENIAGLTMTQAAVVKDQHIKEKHG